jgi:protein CpxP
MNNLKINKWLSIAVLLLLLVNVGTLIMLWKKNDVNPQSTKLSPPPLFDFICNELSFDSAQVKAYDHLRNEHRNGQQQYQDNVRQAKDEFYTLMQKQNLADSSIKIGKEKVTNAIGEFELFNFRHFQQVRNLCNETQKKKFDTIIKEVLNRMGNAKRMPPPEDRENKHFPPPPPPEGDAPPKH